MTALTDAFCVERLGRQDFVYVAADDVYRCPAGERLTYRFSDVEMGKTIRRYWASACGASLKIHRSDNISAKLYASVLLVEG